MGETRVLVRIKAEALYIEHRGDIELVKIVEILNRPPGTDSRS